MGACRVSTRSPRIGLVTHAAEKFVAVPFSRPGDPLAETNVDLTMRSFPLPRVTLAQTEFSLKRGDTARIAVTSGEAVTYESIIPEVATVDATGLITVVGPGATYVVVRSVADAARVAGVEVRVGRMGW